MWIWCEYKQFFFSKNADLAKTIKTSNVKFFCLFGAKLNFATKLATKRNQD